MWHPPFLQLGSHHVGSINSYSLSRILLHLDYRRIEPSACTVFLRDVATSRHSPNKFGSALDFRNVIHISPLRGDL